jgi:hypothetical protein
MPYLGIGRISLGNRVLVYLYARCRFLDAEDAEGPVRGDSVGEP